MIFRGFREPTITVVTRQNLNISRKQVRTRDIPNNLSSLAAEGRIREFFGLRPEHLARLGRRDRRRAGMPSPGVIGQDACLLVGRVGAWIIVPASVRILYATACETEQISTGSGGSGPCPAVCACPDIRGSTYCPPDGSRRPPIRHAAYAETYASRHYGSRTGQEAFQPAHDVCRDMRGAAHSNRLARHKPQRTRADRGHTLRPGPKVAHEDSKPRRARQDNPSHPIPDTHVGQ